ncbi:MAG: hypothetical protein EP298_02505 [Gammaproteobacteria bacterium]|nr:MAG: hypothetical protein EP298_02505 [Gammaproteobacteria bacterium]UTW43441.1 hypothetical protein KFE69_04930 [bacterium SCSIO 12844]
MNDKFTPNGRKKLSLCTPRKNQKSQPDKYQSAKKEQPSQKSMGSKDDQLNWLYKQKERLNQQIMQIERRLIFGFSEPLQNHCYELKRKDMLLSCKISEILIQKLY